eukprot:Sdes_comp20842_c0_seq3m17545
MVSGYPNFALFADQHWWGRKWLVIRRPYLYIYSSDQKGLPEVDIVNISKVKIHSAREVSMLLPGSNKSVFCFDTRWRGFLLKPDHSDELDRWFYALDPLLVGMIQSDSSVSKNQL